MRWLIACVLLVTSSCSFAEGTLYGELQFGAGGVSNSDLDFIPLFGTITLGAFVAPNIGIEVHADAGLADGSDGDFSLDIEEAFGIAARFQSPPLNGLQGFLVLGVVQYTLEQRSDLAGTVSAASIRDDFLGARVSVGLMQRLKSVPNLLFTAEYRHYNANEPLRLDAIVFGLRVNTP